jgi:hypothetical protein
MRHVVKEYRQARVRGRDSPKVVEPQGGEGQRRDEPGLGCDLKELASVVGGEPTVVGIGCHVVGETACAGALDLRAQALSGTGSVMLFAPQAVHIDPGSNPIGMRRSEPRDVVVVVIVGEPIASCAAANACTHHSSTVDAVGVHLVEQRLDAAPIIWIGHGRVVWPAAPGVAVRVEEHLRPLRGRQQLDR